MEKQSKMHTDEYGLKIKELIERPIIRDDLGREWKNKMTDEELELFDKELTQFCIEEGTPNEFPFINVARLSKYGDMDTLYEIYKLCDK